MAPRLLEGFSFILLSHSASSGPHSSFISWSWLWQVVLDWRWDSVLNPINNRSTLDTNQPSGFIPLQQVKSLWCDQGHSTAQPWVACYLLSFPCGLLMERKREAITLEREGRSKKTAEPVRDDTMWSGLQFEAAAVVSSEFLSFFFWKRNTRR